MSTSAPLGGLDRCACKRGFMTLRDCGDPATATCSICSRRVCDDHLVPRVDVKVCAECAARKEEQSAAPAQPPAVGLAGGLGGALSGTGGRGSDGEFLAGMTSIAVRRRTRYYRSGGYRPMWWGTYDPYWQNYDVNMYGGDEDQDDDGGGFGDS